MNPIDGKLLKNRWNTTADYRRFRVYDKGVFGGEVYAECRSRIRFALILDKIMFQETILIDGFSYTNPAYRQVETDIANLVDRMMASLREAGARPDGLSLMNIFTVPKRRILEDALSGFNVVVYWELSKADDMVRAISHSARRRAHELMLDRSRLGLDDVGRQELLDLAAIRRVEFDP